MDTLSQANVIRKFREKLYREPKNTTVMLELGLLLLEHQRPEEAKRWFEGVLKLDSRSIEAVRGLLSAFLKSGLLHSAKEHCERSLRRIALPQDVLEALRDLRKNPLARTQKVTFYIPCYNVQEYVAQSIEAVLQQSYPVEEILVIDDCSTDRTAKIAAQYPVKIIRHEKNKGLSVVRNTALRHAIGKFVASVDADVVPDRYWLEYLMMEFTSDAVAGVGGQLLEENTLTVVDRWRQLNLKQSPAKDMESDIPSLCGHSTVYRKACLEKAGGYNEKLRNNYEDVELSRRMSLLHYKLKHNTHAFARHLRTDSVRSVLDTSWHWRVPYCGELPGRFRSFKALAEEAKIDFAFSFHAMAMSRRRKTFHLLYLDILMGLWSVLKDIVHIGPYSRMPPDVVAQTFLAIFAGFRHALKQKEGVSQELMRFIDEDLGGLTDFLKEEYKGLIPQLDVLYASGASDSPKRYVEIKVLLPYANMQFARKTVRLWNEMFSLDPLQWKMVEVSGRRIRCEREHNPKVMLGLRVLLANPPWNEGSRYGVRAGSRWPFTMERNETTMPGYIPFPLFLAYAAALLKKEGINAVIVDAIAEGLNETEFLERVRGFSPDVVLIEAATASLETDLAWAIRLKDIDKNIKIVFAGTHVSATGGEFLSEHPFVDYVIMGEYEYAFLALCQGLKKRKLPREIQGVVYRDTRGRVVSCGRSKGVQQLDSLPLPERITLPIYNYNDASAGTPSPTVQMMASRGCPFRCTFCLWPQVLYGNNRYRRRSPGRVVDEMEMLVKEYGFKGIYFDDDTFNIGIERVVKICREIQRRRLKVPWSIMARADTTNYRTLSAMKKAGLCAIKFGAESAVQELLDRSGKRLRLNTVAKAVRDCKRLGIKVHLTFTFGLEGETRKTIKKTIAYALRLNPDSVQFSLTTPFPGTQYYETLKQRGLLVAQDWSRYDGNRYVAFRGENLTVQELEFALTEARQAWFSHCRRRYEGLSSSDYDANQASYLGEGKRKIALIDLFFVWPTRGGAGYDISEVGGRLVNRGFSVQMFVPYCKSPFVRGAIHKPLLFPVEQLGFNKNTFTPEIVSQRFREAVGSFGPDYVIIGDGWSLKPYVAQALLGEGYKVFLRFYAHENLCLIHNGHFLRDGSACPYNFLSHREKCLECLNRLIMKYGKRHWCTHELLISRSMTREYHELLKKTLKQVDGIIVYNSMVAKFLSPFNRRVFVIPTGVNLENYDNCLDKNTDPLRKNILMSGRVDDPVKGLDILKAACAKLFRRRKDFLVNVTSNTEFSEPFLKSVGWFSTEMLPSVYKQADICVNPSIWPEPFGIVAVEAMAAGRPVIASNIGGLRDIVVDGVTGFLVTPGSVEELAEKIEVLLDNPGLRERMGRNARKKAEELYDWNKILKKHYLPLFNCSKK